ncbi:MAG: ABC1 kinase family protein [Longimicrobiales bacterium]
MGISLDPRHLRRYGEIARLLYRYGRSDLVQAAGLEPALDAAAEPAPSPTTRARDRRGSVARQRQSAAYEAAVGAGAAIERRTGAALSVGNGEPPGDALARDLEQLGPTFVKLGQLLSTRADLIPPAYLDGLERLQDDLEPIPFAAVQRIIQQELGTRLSRAFSSFEPTPLGSASLGQVHRARLRDGRAVAVKVQRPGIREQIADDLEVLGELAEFLDQHTDLGERYRLTETLEQLRAALVRELDYRREARNLELLGENLRDFERIVVPLPIEDYTTGRILTMDYVRGRKITAVSPLARLEIDGDALADDLFRAYLRQILVDGFFHADPHPGNVFLTDDRRLALLDLGMVAYLGSEMQEHLLKLLLGVANGEGEQVADLALEFCERTQDADPKQFRSRMVELVAQQKSADFGDLQVGAVFIYLNRLAAENGIVAPPELAMLGKTLLNLDEVGRTLDPDFDPNAAIRRHAAAVLQRRMLKRLAPTELFSTMLELNEFVQRLPGRLNRLFDAVSQQQLRLKVESIDERLLISGFEKIANRITMGLVLAALIVGAAMLARIPSDRSIFGYPIVATLLFILAAAGGVALLISIIRGDRHDRQ